MVMGPGAYSTRTFAEFGAPLVIVSLATVSVVTWALLNSGQERRAALIYQHATRERDEEIATAMGRCSPRSGGRVPAGVDRARIGHDGRGRLLDRRASLGWHQA